jgi:hypothetical protein
MLTDKEIRILDMLADCFINFAQLEIQHPDDQKDFADAIHDCQRIIMGRAAVRQHPFIFHNSRR